MIVDKVFGALAHVRRHRRRDAQAFAAIVVLFAVFAPSLAPQFFGHTIYMLGMVAVVVCAGLTDMAFLVISTAVVILAVAVMNFGPLSAGAQERVRLAVFITMAVLTAMVPRRFDGSRSSHLRPWRNSPRARP